ncbi:MAG: hypothetical protein NTX15_07670 [Candidatus Kapabacteria bacterium]|nr:hypothetical protein [Candidatus Kapabacteria bacterium]
MGVRIGGGCASGLQAFYRTTDGGGSWSVSFGSEPLSGLSDGIIFRNGSGFAVSSGVLWRTTDFGRSWSRYSSTGSKIWTEEIAISGSSFLLPTSGADCDGQTRGRGSMRFSNDGGLSWIEHQTGANMFGSFLIDSRRGWGVGDARTVIYTADQGNTWVLRNCGIRGNIDDCWFINDTLGWAVGDGIYRSNFNAPGKTVSIIPSDDVLTICSGDSIYVEANGSFTSYSWDDGTTAQGRVLSEPGRYIVTAFDATTCLTTSDTVRVVLKSAFVPRITATTKAFCEGDSAILVVAGPVVSWLWSTGETTQSIAVRKTDTYTCTTLDSNGCTKSAQLAITVNAKPIPVIQANRSLTICLDDVITLTAQSGFRLYEWNTGETTESITTGKGGKYWVTVTDDNGCVGVSDTVRVIALATRNKAEVQFSVSDGGTIVIQDHNVGEIACRNVQVRNVSPTEPLIISRPFIVGNVFFSIPQSQLPLVIPAGGLGEIQICASAIDSGQIEDTLALPDTCSIGKIPLRSRGLSIPFGGTSRCNVDVSSLVYNAGSSWRLSAPFPVPASRVLTITAKQM